ncbi:MAG: hypothetical protein JXB49_35720 [Bacteroidales bacterium]|nr:hypothetical protein [Bacteroidales bacterium]
MPTLIISVLTGFLGLAVSGDFSFRTVGLSYMFFGLLFHYFIYEITSSNEYYFYFNMGLNKYMLWLITFVLNLVILLILVSI